MTEAQPNQLCLKIDVATGHIIGMVEYPAEHEVEPVDHEGLLICPIEPGTTPHDYQFNRETFALEKRASNPIVELRRRLIAERRAPTDEELQMLTSSGLAPTRAG